MDDGKSRVKRDGKDMAVLAGIGVFSEYQVVREYQVAKINPKADLIKACVIGCAVGTGFGSAINLAQVHAGSTCAIWGLGAIGLSVVLGCKAAGAQRIIGIDINPSKFETAQKFGCTECLNPLEMTGDKGVAELFQEQGGLDYAFECIGNVRTLETALSSLSLWGTLMIIGLSPKGTQLPFSVGKLQSGQRIIGGFFGGYRSREGVEELTEKYVTGNLEINDLITHQFKLDQINEAFDHLKSGKSIRSVIIF